MTVRKIADIHEEELEECEAKHTNISNNYSSEYLYVKMTTVTSSAREVKRRRRWPTLDQLRPKLKKASLMETSLEEEQKMANITTQTKGIHPSMSSIIEYGA